MVQSKAATRKSRAPSQKKDPKAAKAAKGPKAPNRVQRRKLRQIARCAESSAASLETSAASLETSATPLQSPLEASVALLESLESPESPESPEPSEIDTCYSYVRSPSPEPAPSDLEENFADDIRRRIFEARRRADDKQFDPSQVHHADDPFLTIDSVAEIIDAFNAAPDSVKALPWHAAELGYYERRIKAIQDGLIQACTPPPPYPHTYD